MTAESAGAPPRGLPERESLQLLRTAGIAVTPAVVAPDADAAISAGYGSAGERCMAIATIVAVGDVGDQIVGAPDRHELRGGVGGAFAYPCGLAAFEASALEPRVRVVIGGSHACRLA